MEAFQPFNNNPSADTVAAVEHVISLYSTNPALGSPFGTGNNTFGLDPQYKRYAAVFGDFSFQALRRAWIQAATAQGVKTFGYLFTDQEAVNPKEPWLGGKHLTSTRSNPILTFYSDTLK